MRAQTRSLRHYLKIYLQPHRRMLSLLVWAIVFIALTQALRPYFVKLLLDTVAKEEPDALWQSSLVPALGYVALSVIGVLCSRLQNYATMKSLPYVRADVIAHMTHYVLKQGFSYFQDHFSGAITNKISETANGLQDLIIITLERFIGQFLVLLFALWVFMSVDIGLAVIMFVCAILFMVGSLIAARHIHVISHAFSYYRSQNTGHIVDVLSNYASVKLFNRLEHERDLLEAELAVTVDKDVSLHWALFKLYFWQGMSTIILTAGTLFYLLLARHHNAVTVGDFGLVLSLSITVLQSLWQISMEFPRFAKHLGRITQGIEDIYQPLEMEDAPGATELQVVKGEVIFENVGFGYSEETPFFRHHLTIPGGSKIGLVGYSGAGKSTFAHLLLRMYDLDEGRILIDGQDISKVTQHSLHQAISLIPQEATLFHRTVMENIRYAKPDASDDEVKRAAQLAHAHDFILGLEQGYDTIVGERGVKISGGQRQRIAMARAILKGSPILILDEATASLDTITEALIRNSFDTLMRDRTTFVIAHRLSTVLSMDYIIIFDQGKIVDQGTPEELAKRPGIYQSLLGHQSS